MRIDTNSPLLTEPEREQMRRIAERLRQQHGRQPPAEYQRELDRVFGACGEDGDLDARGPGLN